MKRSEKIKALKSIMSGKLPIEYFKPAKIYHFNSTQDYEQRKSEILKNPKNKVIIHVAQEGNEPLDPLYFQ